jgi:hypothetical protein
MITRRACLNERMFEVVIRGYKFHLAINKDNETDYLRTKQSGCWLSSNEVAPLTSISEFGGGKCSRR